VPFTKSRRDQSPRMELVLSWAIAVTSHVTEK